MKRTPALLMMVALAYGGMAAAQQHNGRLKGKIDTHEFDVPVQCIFDQMGKGLWLTAITDGNQGSPQEDTNGDGIAGQINTSVGGNNSNNVAVHIKFGNNEYKFAGRKTVEFRDRGFSWKTAIEIYDNQKRQAYLQEGKSLRDLVPERVYDVDIDLNCQ